MSIITKKKLSNRIIITILILSIASIILICWKDIFSNYFTAQDSLTLIETSRIRSPKDLARIFSEPLMNNTKFINRCKYYRPITSLSYSLDYSLWKLNPFGYHLTDFLLHLFVSILVFFFVNSLTKGRQLVACLSAILFTTHPILVEVVPATARRHDIIAAMFLLLSLILFLKRNSLNLSINTFLSVLFYLFALGAKEIAIIMPILVYFIIYLSFSKDMSFKVKLIQAFRKSFIFIGATLFWLAWRFYVLGGLGGEFRGSLGAKDILISSKKIIKTYILDLIYPADYLKPLFNGVANPFEFGKIGFIATLILFVFFLLFIRYHFLRKIRKINKRIRVQMILPIVGIIFSSAITLVNPWISTHIIRLSEGSYSLLIWCFLCILLSLICLAGINIWSGLNDPTLKKAIFFSIIWLFLPACIFLFTISFASRGMYISIIPLSTILAIIFIESFPPLFLFLKKHYSTTISHRLISSKSNMASWIIISGILASLLAYSPILRTYGEWKDSGEISREFLKKLLEITTQLTDGAILHIYNLPSGIKSYGNKITPLKEPTYLADYSIESWLNLHNPKDHIEVLICNREELAQWPCKLRLEVKKKEYNIIEISVKYDGSQ